MYKAGDDKKWIVAWIKEVPGAITQGKTMKEVNENLYDALGLMLDVQGELEYSPSIDLMKKKLHIITKG